MKKSNLTLIGMPGAGKSTIGIILAKNLAMGFVDIDCNQMDQESLATRVGALFIFSTRS